METISYRSLHRRVERLRGKARQYVCWACGGPAREWAYDHGDPDELTGPEGVYSLDPDRYGPMCRACHWEMDRRTPLPLTIES